MYNLTNITDNANNIYEIAKYTNDLSGGLYFSLVIMVLLVVYMAVFKKQDFKEVFLAGTFLCAVVSVLLFSLEFVGQNFLITPLVLFFAALFLFIFTK